MLPEQFLQEWNLLKEKMISLSNLKKEIIQELELGEAEEYDEEYSKDFRYIKECIKYHKLKEYCPRCSCPDCTNPGPTIEEVD